MANKIKLANNAEYDVVWCGAMDGVLAFELVFQAGMTVSGITTIFNDAQKTETIVHTEWGAAATYTGYTTLRTVEQSRWNKNITVKLEYTDAADAIDVIDIEIIDYEPIVIEEEEEIPVGGGE